jgi:hypothetical protein
MSRSERCPTYATRHRALGLGFTLFGLPQK